MSDQHNHIKHVFVTDSKVDKETTNTSPHFMLTICSHSMQGYRTQDVSRKLDGGQDFPDTKLLYCHTYCEILSAVCITAHKQFL